MMRIFVSNDENVKEMRNDFYGNGKKVNAHELSIKHLEEKMTKLARTV